ncbi:MAG: glycosyl hydrolase [Planctomycetota bacterium]
MNAPIRTTLALVLLPSLVSSLWAQTTDQEHLQANVLQQMPWKELGPVAFGGRIVDTEVHPQNSSVFWAASASGGLWKTTNGGLSFAPQFQNAYSISIGDLAIAPSQPDTLYVGTGESNNQRSSYWGNGVHKSTDGGTTWTHLGLDGSDHIGRIVVHPLNPDVVFVAALGALYTSNEVRGLYRTTDGGASWQRVAHVSNDTGFVDVAIDPQNPDTVYAASYERRRRAFDFMEGGPGSRLWKSTDGGNTFVELGNGLPQGDLGRIGIDLFAKDPRIVYVTIENLNPDSGPAPEPATEPVEPDSKAQRDLGPDAETLADPLALAQWHAAATGDSDEAQDPQRRQRRKLVGGEVYRSDDGGASFKKTNKAPVGGQPGYYYGQIRIDKNDAQKVYVLGVPVFRSTDGGATFTPGERGGRNSPPAYHGNLHVDHHALWLDPRDGDHALLGNDGGLAVTYDAGATWDHLARLPIAQFYSVAVDQRVPYRIYGGLQDNGTWGFPVHGTRGITADSAYRIDGGDGFYVAIDPTDADVVYSESQFGGMSRQNLRTGERASIRPRAAKGQQPLRFNWNTPLVLSPHAPRTVYVGSQFVHRSRDRGASWTAISDDLTTNDADKKRGDVPHCTITTIVESPVKEGLLFVGTDDGKVWRTRDGGARWTDLTATFPSSAQGLWVSRVEASPHDADVAFVAFTGYREDRRDPLLFRTNDGGETFLAIHGDLPQEPINVVRQHPNNPSVLLVGTEMGVYCSIDDGAHFQALGHSLPRVAVHDLVVHPREQHVILGTHGRGIWALDGRGLAALDGTLLQRPFAALPPSHGVVLPRSFSRGYVGARTWSIENPFTVATFRWHANEDQDGSVLVEVLDAAGTVLFRHSEDATAGYHEVRWSAMRPQGNAGGGAAVRDFLASASRGRRQQGQRAGQFAVRITCGETTSTQPFEVLDLRGPRDALGAVQSSSDGDFGDDERDEREDGERDR